MDTAEKKVKLFLKSTMTVVFCIPFVVLFYSFHSLSEFVWPEFLWALKNTLIQAFLSALFSVALGWYSALGLAFLKRQFVDFKETFEFLFVVPSLMPVVFVLLAVLNIFQPFPMGLMGISIVNIMVNVGLMSVAIYSLLDQKMGGMIELATIEGAETKDIHIEILKYLKSDLFKIFLFVFYICFCGFSIPYMVGGDKGITLEILIYEKIKISGDWNQALWLSLIQTGSLFLFGFFLRTKESPFVSSRKVNLSVIESKWSFVIPLAITLIVGWGLVNGVVDGGALLMKQKVLLEQIIPLSFNTLFVGAVFGALIFGMFILVFYLSPSSWMEIFYNSFVPPSFALMGFTLLIFGPVEGLGAFLKYLLAFLVLYFPSLFRMGGSESIRSLKGQIENAKVLGAAEGAIMKQIILPQVAKKISFLSGLGAFWIMGDFAISRIFFGKNLTLAMMLESLMTNYRIQIACVIGLWLLFLGALVFMAFLGVGRVLSRKLE